MRHKILVYGTLRPGDTETVLVPGVLYDLGWYPGIRLLSPDDGKFVTCEVREVSDEGLEEFDTYEGYDADNPEGSLYLRVPFEDKHIYVYNQDFGSRPVVESGDWLQHRRERSGSAALMGVS